MSETVKTMYDTRTISKRDWTRVDFEAFKQDLLSSMLFTNPPVNSDDLFICYYECLQQVVDSHAPLKTMAKRGCRSERWYAAECKEVKAEIRRLERIYRSTHTAAAHIQWRALTIQHSASRLTASVCCVLQDSH